jgi:hypothetical protein
VPDILKVIAMKCPSCGATLQVRSDMGNFSCAYCGSALNVMRQGGTVSLIAEAINKVQIGTDKTAAELALVRLKNELTEVDRAIEKHIATKPIPFAPEFAPSLSHEEFGLLAMAAASVLVSVIVSLLLLPIVAAGFGFAIFKFRADRLRRAARKNELGRKAANALHQEFDDKLAVLRKQKRSVEIQIATNREIVDSSHHCK